MTTHMSRNHAGEEAPIMLKKKRSSESSYGDFRGMKASKVQYALPVVKQVPTYSVELLNVIFVVNVF